MSNRETPTLPNEADLERIVALVEEAAGAVVMASPDDRDAVVAIGRIFEKIAGAAPSASIAASAEHAQAAVTRMLGEPAEAAALLDRLCEIVTDMQRSATEALMLHEGSPDFVPAPIALSSAPQPVFVEPARPAVAPPPPPPAPAPVAAAPYVAPPPPAKAPVAAAPYVAPPPPFAAPALPVAAVRDAEIVELLGDFLQEAEEGVDKVDALLMEIEQGDLDMERINALFRVFHTIKGVAASLEVTGVTRLAHATETLLDQARSGVAELSGERIERVFEAAALMRKLLANTRAAVEKGNEFEIAPEVAPMIARLDAALAGKDEPKAKPVEKVAAPPPPKVVAPAPKPAAPLSSPPGLTIFNMNMHDPIDAPAPPPVMSLVAPPLEEPAIEAPAIEAPQHVQATPAAQASGPSKGGKLRETVKVDLDRVDSIVEMIGELIIVESMVVNAPEIANLSSLRVRNYLSQLTKISRDLQNIAMRMRMVPVQGVFQKMARMVRDLSRKTGKNVILVQSGESAEMDRSMVERIEDPLVHMIRNSVDHGIENETDRAASGKPAVATVKLSAYHEGGSIVIEITDDGRGISREAVIKKARAQGLLRENENPTDAEVWGLIFVPGFSTASQVTEISGRGVGMDVVKRSIESMRGRVTVTSTPGKGTTFRMLLPLTLAIIDGMLVASGDERYIIPSLSIVESLKPLPSMVHTFADRGELINVRGEMLPLVRLARLFGVGGEERAPTDALAVVVESMGRRVGLLVDDVITQQQVVIKPLGEGLGDTDLLAGAAILSDGRVGLILNVDRIGGDATSGQILHRTRTVSEEAA